MKKTTALQAMLRNLEKTEHGFLHIIAAGEQLLEDTSLDITSFAIQLFSEKSFQARSLATHLLGRMAAEDAKALSFLKKEVAADEDWRVQEMLAKAFDQYCKDLKYEGALPVIKKWLADKNPNVVRAVTEGLRIWTGRPYFKTHPDIAIALLSAHKQNPSDYVRRSVGNALRDIGKKHKDLVQAETDTWDISDPLVTYTHKFVYKNR